MSNAMRLGKRSLAGVAAGALAAGMMSFVMAPTASAAATDAATIEWDNPSAVLVGTGLADDTRINFGFSLIDASGDDTTALTSTQKVEIKIQRPSTVTDDSIAYGFDDTTYVDASSTPTITRSVTGGVTTTTIAAGSSLANKYGGVGVYIPGGTAGVVGSWDQAVGAGRNGVYTLTANLINTVTNTVISSDTATFNLATAAGAPAATATWLSGPSYRSGVNTGIVPLTAIGQTLNDNMNTTDDTPVIQLADANGGPYVVDGTAGGMIDLSVDDASTSDDSTSGGWNTAAGTGMTSFYTIEAILPTWSDQDGQTVTVAVDPTGGGTAADVVGEADLAVKVAGAESPGTVDAVLNNASQYRAGDDDYQVPTGTTSLTFDVTSGTSNVDDTTLAWNIWADLDSSYELGIASPTGGKTVQSADEGSVTIAIADGNDAGDVWKFRSGTGASNDVVTVTFADPVATLDTTPPLGKVGDAVSVPGTITDQFGNALLGTWAMTLKATSSCTATSIATATAAADGSFTFDIPASQSPSSADTKTFYACGTNGFSTVNGQPVSVEVTYTATGGVGSLTLAPSSTISGVTTTIRPLTQIPGNGTASLGTATSTVWDPDTDSVVDDSASVTAAKNALRLVATTDIAAPVTFTGTDGVLFTSRTAGSVFYTAAGASYTSSGTATTATVSVFATKPGLHTVTATAGSTSKTYNFYAEVSANSGRVLSVDPTSMTITPESFKTIKYSVSDIYGNPVPANKITVTLAGGGTVASSVSTDSAGEGTVYYTAPAGTGVALATGTGATSQWETGTIAGAPASVRSVETSITVSSGPAPSDKTITITGERGTVKGRPGVMVDGVTTGFGEGTAMVPHIKFPGQTAYSEGSARPKVDEMGDFYWQRKTGKKIYIYFSNEAGDVKSDRIIIQAK